MKAYLLSEFGGEADFPFFIQYGYQWGDFFPHKHEDFMELTIVMDGMATHVVGTEARSVGPGDVFAIGGHTIHEFRSAEEFRLCNLMFRPEYFFGDGMEIKNMPGFHALFYVEPMMSREQLFRSRLKLNKEDFRRVVELTNRLKEEYEGQEEGRRDLIRAYFMELVVFLSRKYVNVNEDGASGVFHMARAAAYMDKNFREPLTIDQIAQVACLSKRHFNRMFQLTYGVTPLQYLIKQRLNYATSLLETGRGSISDIAAVSGFPDNNYFARRFRAQYGKTPLEYRKDIKKTP